jgi:hypothetical protein
MRTEAVPLKEFLQIGSNLVTAMTEKIRTEPIKRSAWIFIEHVANYVYI